MQTLRFRLAYAARNVKPSIRVVDVLTLVALSACSCTDSVSPGPKLDPEPSADASVRGLDAGGGPGDSGALDSAADGTVSAQSGAVEAGPPTRAHGVLRRTCERTPLSPDFLFFPTSTECSPNCRKGTECSSSQDCKGPKGGDCIGLPDARCEYGGVLGASDDSCITNEDCTRGASPRCQGEVHYSFCLYGTCRSDADCAADERCECPTGGQDPVCILLGCDRDQDCPASQTCRVDQSYVGAANRRHCSTPADSCASKADCALPDDACGFSHAERRWLCLPFTMVD
jgi:hypothetical protein